MSKKLVLLILLCAVIGFVAPCHIFAGTSNGQNPLEGYSLLFSEINMPKKMYIGLKQKVTVKIENTGTIPINRSEIFLSYHWRDAESEVLIWDGARTELPADLAPGEQILTTIDVFTPTVPGSYVMEVDAVKENVGWFSLEGKSNPIQLPVEILSTVSIIKLNDIPRLMEPDREYTAEVSVTNISPVTIGNNDGMNLAYHWKNENGDTVIWDGIRTSISEEIMPGETLILDANFITPSTPGRYILEWDLVNEGIAWLGLVEPTNSQSFELRVYSPVVRTILAWSWLVLLAVLAVVARLVAGKLARRNPSFQKINHAINLAGVHFKHHLDIFIFIFILLLKFAYFTHVTGYQIETNGTFITLSVLILLGGLIGSIKPVKWRIVLFGALDLFFSFLIFADLVYWRYFGDILSANVLLQSDQTGDITTSIMKLIDAKDVATLLTSLLIWIAGYILEKKIRMDNIKFRFCIPVLLITVAVGLSSYTIVDLRKDSETHNVFDRFFLNQLVVEKLGLTGFHIYDTYVHLREGTGGVELSDDKIKRINMSFKWNSLFESKNSSDFGIAKDKNLIVVQMESLQEFVVGLTIDGQEITPNLNKLKKEGFYFNRYFDQTNQGRTSDGEFASLVSLYPLPAGSVYFKHPFNNYETSLPNVLKNNGYKTMSAHAYRGDFWNRIQVHRQLGFEVSKFESDMPEGEIVGWGLGDHVFFPAMVDEMAKMEQPFFSFLISLSNHHPYDLVPEKYKSLLLGNLEGTILGNYLHSVHYSDMALGALIERLKEQGLYENSVVVIYGDHDAGLSNKEVLEFLGMDYNDYNIRMIDRVPFLIHIPGMERKELSNIGGHLDMTPTLLHLLGIETDKNFYYGNNLFAKNDEKVVVLPGGSFVTKNYLFYSNGSFENGSCYVLDDGSKIDLGACRKDYETALLELEFSQQILKGDLLGTLRVGEQKVASNLPDENKNWWKISLIAHAMGGTNEGYTYTNSLEAFLENYEKGHRLFEVDLVLTKEDVLVARHDWMDSTAAILEQKVIGGDEPWPYEVFRQTKINKKYTPLSFSDIVNLMKEYPDIYIITDTKSINPGEIRKQFQAIVKTTAGDPLLLDRIIPQYYTPEMYRIVNEIYPFKNGLYTLYMTNDTDDQIIDFLNQNSIDVVTIPTYRISQSFLEKLLDEEKVVFVHTINDPHLARDLLDVGVYGLYTDFLVQGDLRKE